MDEAGPRPPLPDPVAASVADGRSRRWFLAGGVAVLLGGGGGAIAELLRSESPTPAPLAPDALVAAADAERTLIADLDATTGGTSAVREVIVQARADHAAHLAALVALLSPFRVPSSAPSSPVPGLPRTLAQLHTAEVAASAAAARHAAALSGAHAALLASIAACEATHAELLR
jgi:hypothetical protein